ncbi:FAD-linked oxidase C-terminal domain-containing protein [Aquirufa sp. LEPPI-3A]|uniref:FAD-binding and (Fe-S)-binding domain-containing protein n=1 Tax=Aquirufa regiilacus TaxID=3024868 RepID=UPI0028E017A1|nr:FAD-linked oxidase C-terminal domain-containing protein [Aquirufa sp. LEPPI-3A]MDT8886706.1 FAD-linked oxidase C-terminal domain-containing protein [Aquirufa sp. LEPPI-3A]
MHWSKRDIEQLKIHFEGELFFNDSQTSRLTKRLYATDASVYEVEPTAVAIPMHAKDMKRLIQFAATHKTNIIPRGAGTSLAGQVVGDGIVLEISAQMAKIIQLNKKEQSVWVEPGIIRDDLNKHLAAADLFFGPETSTANRALIGGMIGNNSCGLHSIVWGTTRDHLMETRAWLSDGTEIHTEPLSLDAFYKKTALNNLEGKIYRELHRILNNPEIQLLIKNAFPKAEIKRRNTGYALDALIEMQPFNPNGKPFNLSALFAGSEGTLAVVHAAKLNLLNKPEPFVGLLCLHCTSLQDSLKANILALDSHPTASELVDDFILSFTENHPNFKDDRSFIEGKPAAILMVEFRSDSQATLDGKINQCIASIQEANLAYAFPVLYGDEISKGWDIRKAGLGLIRNQTGLKQPVNLIEDCAVAPIDLPAYVADIQALLAKNNVQAAYYAHAGAGELHIEPFLDIHSTEGKTLFRSLLTETVEILKKYKGSLSGEHGDGRLRGEFIPQIMGDAIYQLFVEIKQLFDPNNILNPGKIVHSPPMDEAFRKKETKIPQAYYFHYLETGSPLGLAEKCSGSGDCKKTALTGGTMCPSFMASQKEKDSTRGRANILRQLITESGSEAYSNPELLEVLDLCLSCKGCQTECPSGVDMAKLKAETLQQHYDKQGTPWRTQMVGHFPSLQKLASYVAPLYNLLINFPGSSILLKSAMGFSWNRSIPEVHFTSLESWHKAHSKRINQETFPKGFVYVFADEFTNYNEVALGKKTILLLNELGYGVKIPNQIISGRTYISKGMLAFAKKLANTNVEILKGLISKEHPFIGIEPSAILSFRDEIPHLVEESLRQDAMQLKENCLLIDEFLLQEIKAKHITADQFTDKPEKIVLHGHCHQKSIAGISSTRQVLNFPTNYEVELLPTGCCGMAGSFGYDKKHYNLSQQIAKLVLYPRLLATKSKTIIAMNGTSCRHQIKDGIDKEGFHTAEIMYKALAQKQFKL